MKLEMLLSVFHLNASSLEILSPQTSQTSTSLRWISPQQLICFQNEQRLVFLSLDWMIRATFKSGWGQHPVRKQQAVGKNYQLSEFSRTALNIPYESNKLSRSGSEHIQLTTLTLKRNSQTLCKLTCYVEEADAKAQYHHSICSKLLLNRYTNIVYNES